MAGIYFQSPEPDLSHFRYQNNIGILVADFVGQKPENTSSSAILPWALLVSLAIHAVLLSLNFTATNELKVSAAPQIIHVELQPVHSNSQVPLELIEPVVEESVVEAPVVEIPAVTHVDDGEGPGNGEKNAQTDKAEKQSVFIPITPDELQSLQKQPTYSLEPSDANLEEVNSKPFGSVFDPRLRKKLQEQHAEKQAKALGITTYELANGSTVVKLSDNHCLSTFSQGKKENETNWYHTGCHEKTEGERMMDRVNESMRLKRK